jgi:hypothetical protein
MTRETKENLKITIHYFRHSDTSLHIFIQQSFKSTIEFVRPTMMYLKMRYVGYIFI